MPVSHTVYGLQLAANVSIPGLSVQVESKPADVRIWLKDSASYPPRVPLQRLYGDSRSVGFEGHNLRVTLSSDGEYFSFFYSDDTHFVLQSRGTEVWGDWPGSYTLEDACTYLLGPVMGFILRLRAVTALHASAVALDNCAVALIGAPGAGKSTIAAAFSVQGFQVLSDDIVALEENEKRIIAQPGYPRLNLWSDSVRALFGSEDALPLITSTWDKRYLPLEMGSQFASEPLPLRAIYVLRVEESSLTRPLVRPTDGTNAFITLVANTYANYLLDRQMRSHEFEVLSRIVTEIPIRIVHRPSDISACRRICDIIAADAMTLS